RDADRPSAVRRRQPHRGSAPPPERHAVPLSQLAAGIPPKLDAAVMQALAKQPDQRDPSAQAMLTALGGGTRDAVGTTAVLPRMSAEARRHETGALLGMGPHPDPLPEGEGTRAGWRRRRRVPVGVAALAALMVAGLVAAGGAPELRFTRKPAVVDQSV